MTHNALTLDDGALVDLDDLRNADHLEVVKETDSVVLFADHAGDELREWAEEKDIGYVKLCNQMHEIARDMTGDASSDIFSSAYPVAVRKNDDQLTETEQEILDRWEDGQTWKDKDGVRITDWAKEQAERIETGRMEKNIRYIFDDGGVLTATEGAWDFGYRDCNCWRGAGHDKHCEQGEHPQA